MGISDRAGDDDLQHVTLVKQRGEAVGGREQSELRNESRECLESFFRPIAIELVAGRCVQTIENDRGDRIRAGGWRMLNRLAADLKAAHRSSVFRAIEEAAGIRIAEALDGFEHQVLGFAVVLLLLRQSPSVEKRSAEKYEIVERSIETRSAHAVQHADIFVPGFRKNAIESFQRESSAVVAAKNARCFEICGDEHRVPADVESCINRWDWTAFTARGEQFPLGAGDEDASGRFVEIELRSEIFDRGRAQEDIFL